MRIIYSCTCSFVSKDSKFFAFIVRRCNFRKEGNNFEGISSHVSALFSIKAIYVLRPPHDRGGCPYVFFFSFPGDNLRKYQWIITKVGMCIDIIEI